MKGDFPMIREVRRDAVPGIPVLLTLLVLSLALIAWLISAGMRLSGPEAIAASILLVVTLVLYFGLYTVNPNQGKVLQLFGAYRGTSRSPGLRWTNPFYTRKPISLRVRNFETGKLKVNDRRGNPVEIACVVVWKVVDTAEAVFQVDSYENFVHVQSEAALRNLATGYPYDAHQEGQLSLRMSAGEISHRLRQEIQDRLTKAGVEVIEARITHLAYAPEIANAMLRRQQANAVIAARSRIVEGAVSMVEMALEQLSSKHIVDLDEERKAQ